MAGIEEGCVEDLQVCEGCYLSYGDFEATYYEKCEAFNEGKSCVEKAVVL